MSMNEPWPPRRRSPWRVRPISLRRYWPALALLAIVAVTAGVFVWGGRDDKLQARVGQAFDAPYSFGKDTSVVTRTLRLPATQLEIDVTAPQSTVPAGEDADDRSAPDDGSFIGVYVRSDNRVLLPQPAVDDVDTPDVSVHLVVGSHRYVVPPPFRQQPDQPAYRLSWVAVAGSPRDARVAVTYDGVTQSVDARSGTRTTGVAAPLYRVASLTTAHPARSCGTPAAISNRFRVERDDSLRCQVQPLGNLPYLPGRGWAPKGTTWYTVLVGLFDDARFTRDGEDFRATIGGYGPLVTASVPGSAARVLGEVSPTSYLPSGAPGRLAAFAVPVGASAPAITLVADYSDLVRSESNPVRTVAVGPDVRVTWKVSS